MSLSESKNKQFSVHSTHSIVLDPILQMVASPAFRHNQNHIMTVILVLFLNSTTIFPVVLQYVTSGSTNKKISALYCFVPRFQNGGTMFGVN